MNFNTLSNANLVSCFENIVRSERKITAQVLECIAEIDRRRLYIDKGFTSLFDYLVKDVGNSPGAAMRRIDAARLLRELPEVVEKFESGSLTLSQATQVQRAAREYRKINKTIVSTEEKRELFLQIENSSQKETEQIIATALDLPTAPIQKETIHRDHSVTLTITLTSEQMEILEQAQNMISHAVVSNNWAETLTYLAKKEVARRSTLRTSKPATAVAVVKVQDAQVCRQKRSTIQNNLKRSAVPAKVRKALLHPSAVCAHIDKNGKTCSSQRFLQIDHIKSWSRGGPHKLENLQVLCGVHNRLKYERERKEPWAPPIAGNKK